MQQMKISELIKELEEIKQKVGDIPVCFNDEEYGATSITLIKPIKKDEYFAISDCVLLS